MTNGIVVRPLRFSADVEAMRRFLELLGLRSRIESERGAGPGVRRTAWPSYDGRPWRGRGSIG